MFFSFKRMCLKSGIFLDNVEFSNKWKVRIAGSNLLPKKKNFNFNKDKIRQKY